MSAPTPVVAEGPITPFERAVDLSSRFLYLVPYFFFIPNGVHELQHEWKLSSFLILVSEGLGCLFALTARFSRKVDRSFWVVLFTLASGQYYIFVSFSDGSPILPTAPLNAFMILGIVLSMVGKIWLGRSWGRLPANRGVVTGGPYRLVRHPIYLGYTMGELGFLLATFSATNVVVTVIGWVLQAVRILLEEKVLLQDPGYAAYARQVRYRLIPYVF